MVKTIEAYHHPPADPPAQVPDTQPGNYYVSVRDGERHGFLLGPFVDDHEGALAWVGRVRVKSRELDPRAVWYAFGTCRSDIRTAPGLLNEYFPEAGGQEVGIASYGSVTRY